MTDDTSLPAHDESTDVPTDQPEAPQPDDTTPATPEQIASLQRQLRELNEQIERDRRRMRDNEIARLVRLRDAETDEATRREIQTFLDQVLAEAEAEDAAREADPGER